MPSNFPRADKVLVARTQTGLPHAKFFGPIARRLEAEQRKQLQKLQREASTKEPQDA